MLYIFTLERHETYHIHSKNGLNRQQHGLRKLIDEQWVAINCDQSNHWVVNISFVRNKSLQLIGACLDIITNEKITSERKC